MKERNPALARCVPSTGQHPGEVHESLLSWIDPATDTVRLTVRHLASGDVSEVELFKTCFGERALAAAVVIAAGMVAADAVLCDWETARSRASITPDSWRRGMAFDGSISRRRMSAGEVSPELVTAGSRGSAGTVVPAGPVLCPWCAIERAMNGQGAASRTGFVAVARCGRHCAESPVLLAPKPHTPPAAGCALSRASGGLSR